MLVKMSRALLAMLENEGDDARLFTKKYIYTMLVMLAARKISRDFALTLTLTLALII